LMLCGSRFGCIDWALIQCSHIEAG
jgi:hypothetical protein